MNPMRVALTAPRDLVLLAGRVTRAAAAGLGALEKLPELIQRVELVVVEIEALVLGIDDVRAAAGDVAQRIEVTRIEAGEAFDGVDRLRRRVETIVDGLEPLLGKIGAVDLRLPDELADLLHRVGPLLEQVETVVLPMLREVRSAVPDVREILPVVQRLEPMVVDVDTRLAGLPGASRLRKRGEKEIEEANAAAELQEVGDGEA